MQAGTQRSCWGHSRNFQSSGHAPRTVQPSFLRVYGLNYVCSPPQNLYAEVLTPALETSHYLETGSLQKQSS